MSLRDQVLKSTSGRLAQTVAIPDTPTTSTLAGSQTAVPITPVGVGALGGTAKQQDMAGSKAQKSNALKQSLDRVNTLQEAQADRQARTAMTAEEQQAKQRGDTLQNLLRGNAPRVQQMVSTEVAKLQGAQLSKSRSGLLASQADKQADVDNLYDQLQALSPEEKIGEKGVGLVNQIAQLTGKEYRQLAQTVLDEAEKQKEEAAKLAADATSDTIDLDMLLPELGINKQEMAGLLGVPETLLDKLSLTELSNLLDQAVGRETVRTDSAAISGLGGAAEREAARQRSIDLSASGVASTEAAMRRLSDEIEQSQVVQFAGKQWNVGDLLSDENVSRLIADYILNPDSAESKKLAADPQAAPLIDFIKRNEEALRESAQQFKQVADEASAIQSDNKGLSKFGNTQASDALMARLVPGWGETTNVRQTSAVINQIRQLSEAEQGRVAAELEELAQLNPQMLDKMVSQGQLESEILRNAPSWKSRLQSMRNARTVGQMDPASPIFIDNVISMLFGNTADTGTFQQAVSVGGLDKSTLDLFDRNRDGAIDNPAAIQERLQANPTALYGIQDRAMGGLEFAKQNIPADASPDLKQKIMKNKSILADGQIDTRELKSIPETPEWAEYLKYLGDKYPENQPLREKMNKVGADALLKSDTRYGTLNQTYDQVLRAYDRGVISPGQFVQIAEHILETWKTQHPQLMKYLPTGKLAAMMIEARKK